MYPQNIYCRLCAEPKPSNKQVELQSDAEKRNEITQKLSRINATTEFHCNNLPTTVCRDCVSTLDICFDFVLSIEQAQKVLKERAAQPDDEIEEDDLPLSSCKDKYHFQFKNSTKSDTSVHLHNNIKLESDSEESFMIGDDEHLTNTEFNETESFHEEKEPIKPKKEQIPDPFLQDKTWADYIWKCTYCESEFPTILELQSHGKENHKACNPYKCTDCNFQRSRLGLFVMHVKSHHKELKHSCYLCLNKFESKWEVKKHMGYSHPNTKLSCHGCRLTFNSKTQLKLHTETYYQLKKKPVDLPPVPINGLTCGKCSKTFKTKMSLRTHILHMHAGRKKNFVCETCGKCCYDKSILAEHAFTHTNKRPHKCPVCKLGFKRLPVLRDHLARHNDEKPFSCNQCGSSFRLMRDLRRHKAIHSGTTFQCRFCSKKFAVKEYLTRHEQLHSGVKPYCCDICGHSYAGWPNYNKHMKQRHNIDTSKKKILAVSSVKYKILKKKCFKDKTAENVNCIIKET